MDHDPRRRQLSSRRTDSPLELVMSQPANIHALFVELASGRHGNFAAKLADAWFVADSTNRNTIEMSFPGLIWKAHKFVTPPEREAA
jgi:hypothetical protein